MRDVKIAILEDQVDALAARVADSEERFARLMRVLTSGKVPGKLGLDAKEIELRCQVIGRGSTDWNHHSERRAKLAKAELDAFRRRVAHAESVAELSGKSFLEAFDATRHNTDDDEDDVDDDLVPGTPDQTIWTQVLLYLTPLVNRYSFVTWLQDTTLIRDDGEQLVVRTPDLLGAEWLTKHYSSIVVSALAALDRPNTRVKFVAATMQDD